MASGTTIAQ
jgi:hypothetical protein